MNVLQLISSSGFFGAERVLLELCQDLQRRGHRATVGVFVHDDAPVELARRARELEIEVVEFRCHGRIDLGVVLALGRHLRRHRVDLVHSHGYKADIYAALAGVGRARVATCHGWLTDSRKLLAFELLDKALLHTFDHAAAVSPQLLDELAAARIPARKRSLIENGVSLDADPGARARIRREFGFAPEQLVLVSVGRMDRWKAFDVLLDALAALLPDHPRCRLLLVGDGELRADLERHAQHIDIVDKVSFAGYRKDVGDLLMAGDLFVSSSVKEGLPMVLLEGLAACLAPVCTRVGAIPDVLQDGRCGVLVEPGDAGALADGLRPLLADDERRTELARLAHLRYEENYSRQAMGRRYEALYRRATERR